MTRDRESFALDWRPLTLLAGLYVAFLIVVLVRVLPYLCAALEATP